MQDQTKLDPEKIRMEVRQHYGGMASRSDAQARGGCCSSDRDTTSLLYDIPEASQLPIEVRSLSAGCGDPVTLAELEPGQVVVDLGSGGGIDCFLAAQRVGERGYVIGVDMTAEMLSRARANKARMGVDNVEFRLGEIEHLPVADESADVIVSNCVINLSPDKPQVFREAFRTLKSGGRLAITDIVADGPLPTLLEENPDLWAGCVAGAIDKDDYITELERAGFVDVNLVPNNPDPERVTKLLEAQGIELAERGADGDRKLVVNLDGEWKVLDLGDRKPPFSARITARKP